MRSAITMLAIALLAGVTLAGCGSSAKPAASSAASSGDANAAVTATGAFGKAPDVTIPKEKASSELAVKTLITGTGPALSKTDEFVGNYVVYTWDGTGHQLRASTYTSSSTPTLFTTPLLNGLQTALDGKPVGSRVLAVIPPKDGFGSAGNSQADITATTTLVFVIDVISAFPGADGVPGTQTASGGGDLPTVTAVGLGAPTVKIPASPVKPPTTLQVKTLIKGTGPALNSGDLAVVQYVGVNWRTGKVFDSSWSRKQPYDFVFDSSDGLIPGWNTGLAGVTAGSRVLLVIPPSDGYGSAGQSQAGIKGTDTLVFVIDVLGSYGKN
jgi:FKBP-type peptidyl-prolyl cis-trans isomerase